MITNLLCSVVVTLVTNVFDTDNHKGCGVCGMLQSSAQRGLTLAINHPYHADGLPYIEATAKTNTTQIIRRTDVSFMLNGKPFALRDEETVSQTNRVFLLQSDWKEAK